MRRRPLVRVRAVAALLLGVIAVGGLVLYYESAATPAIVNQAANEAWSALQCSDGEFMHSGDAGRDLRNSERVYDLRCEADNPTGFVALIGLYDQPDLARHDVRIYAAGPAYGPACVTSRLAVIGFFTANAMKKLCHDLKGTFVPKP